MYADCFIKTYKESIYATLTGGIDFTSTIFFAIKTRIIIDPLLKGNIMENNHVGRAVFYILALFGLKVAILIGIRKYAERMIEELRDPQET